MRPKVPHHLASRRWLLVRLVAGLLALGFSLSNPAGAFAQQAQRRPGRQVTIFGIVATPNNTAIDPKLKAIAPQLRELLPNHGFRLLDVKTKRLVAGQAVTCDLGNGASASTTLIRPIDDDGKVQLRCDLVVNDVNQNATLVNTPPNQLFFCDKVLDDGSRLLIGIGAR
ncbi:hypothetical protein [Singulisphaera sp. PoT]|uniref:hypothetical protein n=1 Tax=Singulisphaera sp. PoT TaxID=3411797 RepID=UPI003BF4648A